MRRLAPWALVLLALACEVPDPPPTDGGLDDDGDVCGPGLLVVSSDYQSSSVAFVRWSGEVAAAHVISSGSTASALTAPLSGDVVAPTIASGRDEVVLVDRYPASVLTWVRVADGAPARQLSVRTGFAANAQDWLAVSAAKGYASRYQANPDPGREPFDAGSDLLVVDPQRPAIVGRIGFEGVLDGEDAGLVPSPGRMVLAADRVVALLSVFSSDFQTSGQGRLAVIDPSTDAIEATHLLPGVRGCWSLARSPGGSRVAVGCCGTFEGSTCRRDDGGVAVVDVPSGAIEALIPASSLAGPPSSSIAFASEGALLVPTIGREAGLDGSGIDDALQLVPIDGSAPTTLLTGAPFTIGDVRCAPECGTCVVADAGRGVVQRVILAGDGATLDAPVRIEDGIGLPPRSIGALPRATD